MWKEWIKQKGIRQISKELNLTYEAVRCWCLGIRKPEGENLKNLVALAFKSIPENEFEGFLNSLAQDILGRTLERSHAVNE